MTVAPAGLPYQRKNTGDGRTPILATGISNEHLVRWGEFYLSLDFLEQWDELLGRMNAGKRGRPCQYPEPFIEWMACIHIFLQMPYRQMEGFTRKLATALQPSESWW